jgi:hypothetical protein
MLMLRMFHNGFQVISGVFASVLNDMFQVFHLSSEYDATVASGCFRTRSGVTSPSSFSVVSPRCLLLPALAVHPLPPHPLLDVGNVQGGMSPV